MASDPMTATWPMAVLPAPASDWPADGGRARAARGGQEQAVVRVAEDRLAAQRRDDLLSQGITGEVDQCIFKYPGRDKLSQRR
jgi:hypothetical protein